MDLLSKRRQSQCVYEAFPAAADAGPRAICARGAEMFAELVSKFRLKLLHRQQHSAHITSQFLSSPISTGRAFTRSLKPVGMLIVRHAVPCPNAAAFGCYLQGFDQVLH